MWHSAVCNEYIQQVKVEIPSTVCCAVFGINKKHPFSNWFLCQFKIYFSDPTDLQDASNGL